MSISGRADYLIINKVIVLLIIVNNIGILKNNKSIIFNKEVNKQNKIIIYFCEKKANHFIFNIAYIGARI
ncbi:hypothetical protein GWI99_04170 [Proteus sp. G2609]|nr:hypothetical protein [Proteus sp. G2609]